jgi:hypothetical protein
MPLTRNFYWRHLLGNSKLHVEHLSLPFISVPCEFREHALRFAFPHGMRHAPEKHKGQQRKQGD